MSPLTKLFVVMLVVLSLLSDAAMIVYINKDDVTQQANIQTKNQLDAQKAENATLQQQLSAVQQNATAVQQQANDQARASSQALTTAQSQIAELNVSLAKASGQAASQLLSINQLTEALNANQTAATKFADEVTRLRGSNDTLVKNNSDLNTTVSDLTNKLDVTERERRNLAEQLSQTSADNQHMSAVIKGAGLSAQEQQAAVNRSGLPAINGVVREVRNINGTDYATISVGSADGVTQGMQFKVIDRENGNFLGTCTVDQVAPNEATGRIVGPNVAAIKPGVEVKTQL